MLEVDMLEMPKNPNLVGIFWKNLTLRFVVTFLYGEE